MMRVSPKTGSMARNIRMNRDMLRYEQMSETHTDIRGLHTLLRMLFAIILNVGPDSKWLINAL